MNLLQEAINCL